MSFGIRVRNDQQSVQIDSTYTAFRVIDEGHAPYNQPHPLPSSSQILLVRPGGGTGIIGSTWINDQWYVSSDVGVDWVLLQLSNTTQPASERFGLRIWGDNGLVYDSASRLLHPRINGIFDGNLSTPRTVVTPGAPLHGRKRYVEWSFMRRHYGMTYNQGSGLPYGRTVVATASFSSNQVSVGLDLGSNTAPVNAPPTRAIIKFMVADA